MWDVPSEGTAPAEALMRQMGLRDRQKASTARATEEGRDGRGDVGGGGGQEPAGVGFVGESKEPRIYSN